MQHLIPVIAFVAGSLSGIAQQSDVSAINQRKVEFGFGISTNYTTKRAADKGWQPGFSLSTTAEYGLSEKIFLHTYPTLSFITYDYLKQNIEETNIELPLAITCKPFGSNLKPIVSTGANYKINLNSSSHAQCFWDCAIGIEKRLKYFLIAPEIRYSYHPSMQTIYLGLNFRG